MTKSFTRQPVYLCGAMEGVSKQDMVEWRQTSTNHLIGDGIPVLDPTRREEFHSFSKMDSNLSNSIVKMDLQDIDDSRVVLANLRDTFGGRCWGTISEVTYAHMKGKVIIGLVEKGFRHPFLDYFLTVILVFQTPDL